MTGILNHNPPKLQLAERGEATTSLWEIWLHRLGSLGRALLLVQGLTACKHLKSLGFQN